jgi:rhodanese-related sulfurtransferase
VRITVKALLNDARGRLERLTPEAAWDEASGTAFLVDIRSDSQRVRDGVVPGATVIPRNVLEWRLDPESPTRLPVLAVRGNRVILICDEGYQSSLAAATLQRFGLDATDVIGGAQAWKGAGLPLESA